MTDNKKSEKKNKVEPLGLGKRLKEATPEQRREMIDGLPHPVGFAKPPRETQFKKGRSGNPKGRPAGSRNMRTIVADELAQPIIVTEGGRQRKMPTAQVVIRQCVQKALKGDLRAIIALAEMARRSGQFEEKITQSELLFTPEQIETAGAVVAAFNAATVKTEVGGAQ